MTEALSSLPFEKGGNLGGNAFFITVSPGQFLDLPKSNSINKLTTAAICATRKFRMVVAWWSLHIWHWNRISNSRVNLVKWGISIAGIPDGCRFDSFVGRLRSMQHYGCNRLILLFFAIVAEQKQTYIGHNLFVFVIFYCPKFVLLAMLHRCPGSV